MIQMNSLENDLITVQEMSTLLKISRSKAYNLIKDTTFPIIKIGKCIRISKKELESWLHNEKNVL